MEENIPVITKKTPKEKRQLLPLWIKIFLWLFLVFGCIAPLGLIFALLNISFQLSLYGIATNDPTSLFGILLLLLFIYKGYTAFALWTGKKHAVLLAQIDAVSGILICVAVMVFSPGLTLRLELIALIPYLLKMNKIKEEWINS